jgi:hypothetical protein
VQMAQALRECVFTLAHGMQWFMLSIVAHSVRVLHPCISGSVLVIVIGLTGMTRASIGRITANLHLSHREEVHLAEPTVAGPQPSFEKKASNCVVEALLVAKRGALALAWEDLRLMGDQASEGGARKVAEGLIRTQQRPLVPPSPVTVPVPADDIESAGRAEAAPAEPSAPSLYPHLQLGERHGSRRSPRAEGKAGGILSFFWKAL